MIINKSIKKREDWIFREMISKSNEWQCIKIQFDISKKNNFTYEVFIDQKEIFRKIT